MKPYKYICLTIILIMCNAMLVHSQNKFITTWKTDNPGESSAYQIIIPTASSGGYDYNIYWEEITNPVNNGNLVNQTGDATITFPNIGVYRIEIEGDFPQFKTNNNPQNGDRKKLIGIEQWGDNVWQSFYAAFKGCSNMEYNATDVPDLTNITSLQSMFEGCLLFNGAIGNWDVSNITNMSSMFDCSIFDVLDGPSTFNQDINSWDVSNVANMGYMFSGASAFNQDIGSWDVSNVTTMGSMFERASAFDQDISTWDVSNVTYFSGMFRSASTFNQDIGGWDINSNVTTMSRMFEGASSFNQDIGNWDVGNIRNMLWMFRDASAFNQDIGNWDVSSVEDMSGVFRDASAFDQGLRNWDVSSVEDMMYMFSGALAFDQDLGDWDISNVTHMSGMFSGIALSVCNYGSILNRWSQLTLQDGVEFGGGNSHFPSEVTLARQSIIDNFNWDIADQGAVNDNCDIVSSANASLIYEENNLKIYPNPFTQSSYIEFSTKQTGKVSIEIFDIQGKLVSTLANEDLSPGEYKYTFNGSDQVAGIYTYIVKTKNYSESGKMILLE